jgi:hypothetical protein
MSAIRRTLTWLAVPFLAASCTALAAPAHAATVPVGCSGPIRLLAKTGWLTTDKDGTVHADAAAAPADEAQQFRFCQPPTWAMPATVIRSEYTGGYLTPDTLTGRVRAVGSPPTSAARIVTVSGLGGSGEFWIRSESTGAFYDAHDTEATAPVYATAPLSAAESWRGYPVP